MRSRPFETAIDTGQLATAIGTVLVATAIGTVLVATTVLGATGSVAAVDGSDTSDVSVVVDGRGDPIAGVTPDEDHTVTNRSASSASIVELYPNPTAEGNHGEYLVVELPESGNWSLHDGHHEASIPENATGTVALSMAPNRTRSHVDDVEIRRLDDHFPLSAAGDRIELRRDGDVVDVVAYDRVREGHRWRVDWDEWRPDGYVPRGPVRIDDASVTPFVLPDSPDPPIDRLKGAEERLLIAGYTIESERVVELLIDAADRDVTVRVLVEGTPVGGFPERGAAVADRLDDAGVEVVVLDGDPDRFRFHHAKYAVADDRGVVLTENWKASGTGGRSNRGWGVATTDPRIADELAALFESDARAPDTRSWAAFREETEFHESGSANGTYPTRFDPPERHVADVELLTAPGNAEDRIVERIDEADRRVLAVVPRTDGSDGRIVRALRRAADRGVDTHLLLSGAWYDRDRNRELARALDDDPVEVRIAEPRGRFEKVHAKGLIIDDAVVVGSLNWNEVAATDNREVLFAVESAHVADFYARAYAADWHGGGRQLPVTLLVGLGVALCVAGVVARREVRFVGSGGLIDEPTA